MTFPTGQISVLNVFSSVTLPQLASLFPLLDGEPVDRILVAAASDGTAALALVTASGRSVRVDELSAAAQGQLARALQLAAARRE